MSAQNFDLIFKKIVDVAKSILIKQNVLSTHAIVVSSGNKGINLIYVNLPPDKQKWHDTIKYVVKETNAFMYALVADTWYYSMPRETGIVDEALGNLKPAGQHPNKKEAVQIMAYTKYGVSGNAFIKYNRLPSGSVKITSTAISSGKLTDNLIGNVFGGKCHRRR